MGETKVVQVTGEAELDKRTYLPGVVLTANCPVCDRECETDLGQIYLSYPRTNVPDEVYMACGDEHGVDHPHVEWGVEVIVRMSVEIGGPTGNGWSPDEEIKALVRDEVQE